MDKLVIIRWLDAHELEGEIGPEDIEANHHGYPTDACGYLLKSDATGVMMAVDIRRNTGKTNYFGVHFVPRGMILAEKVIPAPDPTRKRKKRRKS